MKVLKRSLDFEYIQGNPQLLFTWHFAETEKQNTLSRPLAEKASSLSSITAASSLLKRNTLDTEGFGGETLKHARGGQLPEWIFLSRKQPLRQTECQQQLSMGNIKLPGGALTGYYVVDRQRSLHVDNFPKKVTQASVQELFEELLQSKGGNFLSRAGGTRRTVLVSYVLLRSEEDGKTHAWIEFSTEALADLALDLCKLHPEALKVGRTFLAVQRPKGYTSKPPAIDSDSFNEVLQSASPNTVGNTNNKDYVIDRKRALYAEGAPFDATGQEICRLFEGLLKGAGVEKVAGLVTHVIFARRCCAWVEFLSEEVADFALGQCHMRPESLKIGKNVLSVRRAYEVVRLLREEQENTVIQKGVFDWDYSVDRARAIVAKNLPDNTSGPGIYHLFRNILLQSGKIDPNSGELVTHIIWQPGKSFALVEFGSDGLADLAFQLCKMKPDAVRLGQQRLLVERPACPKLQPNGSLPAGMNGSDLGLHVKVPQSPPSNSSGVGGLAQQLAQQGLNTPSPGGKKSALPRDIFSLSYSIDRQRALHVDALPDEEEGPGIRAMFEKLCTERGLIGGDTGLTAAIAHIVRPPGRTFAWVEFNSADVADTVLELFVQDLDTAKLGGHRVIVQRPKGYKANSPNSRPNSLHSPNFDEDSFPSLPSSGKSESFLGSSVKSEASSFASAAAKRNGGSPFDSNAFPVLQPSDEDSWRLLSRHASLKARLDAFSSLTVPEAKTHADVRGDVTSLNSAVDRLLEDSAFSKLARFPSGSASPAYGAISPPLGPIGPTTRPSSASSNQSAFGWGSENADVLANSALTLEPPHFSTPSSEASPFASSYFNSPAFSAASPFSLTPRENPPVVGAALSTQLSGGSSNFSLYSSSPVDSIWGAAGNTGGWSNFGNDANGHSLRELNQLGRKGGFESLDRWGMAAGFYVTG